MATVKSFFRVMVCAWLVVSTISVPKLTAAGNAASAAVPVPLNVAVWGVFEASSPTVSCPVRAPAAVGVKVTETWQLVRLANVLGETGQVEVAAKSPEVEIPEMVTGTI